MNWTGGRLQRHSKAGGKALINRQKQHFAKARACLQNGVRRESVDFEPLFTQPTREAHFIPEVSAKVKEPHIKPTTSTRVLEGSQSRIARRHTSNSSLDCHEASLFVPRKRKQTSPLGPSESESNSQSLMTKKRRLLQSKDWVGLDFSRPVVRPNNSGCRRDVQSRGKLARPASRVKPQTMRQRSRPAIENDAGNQIKQRSHTSRYFMTGALPVPRSTTEIDVRIGSQALANPYSSPLCDDVQNATPEESILFDISRDEESCSFMSTDDHRFSCVEPLSEPARSNVTRALEPHQQSFSSVPSRNDVESRDVAVVGQKMTELPASSPSGEEESIRPGKIPRTNRSEPSRHPFQLIFSASSEAFESDSISVCDSLDNEAYSASPNIENHDRRNAEWDDTFWEAALDIPNNIACPSSILQSCRNNAKPIGDSTVPSSQYAPVSAGQSHGSRTGGRDIPPHSSQSKRMAAPASNRFQRDAEKSDLPDHRHLEQGGNEMWRQFVFGSITSSEVLDTPASNACEMSRSRRPSPAASSLGAAASSPSGKRAQSCTRGVISQIQAATSHHSPVLLAQVKQMFQNPLFNGMELTENTICGLLALTPHRLGGSASHSGSCRADSCSASHHQGQPWAKVDFWTGKVAIIGQLRVRLRRTALRSLSLVLGRSRNKSNDSTNGVEDGEVQAVRGNVQSSFARHI